LTTFGPLIRLHIDPYFFDNFCLLFDHLLTILCVRRLGARLDLPESLSISVATAMQQASTI
jgi:hypothetical protein